MKSIWTACPRCSASIEITFSISSWQCCRVNSRQTRFRRQCTTCPMWHWASSSTVVRQHTTPTTRSPSTAFRSGYAEETGSQPQLHRFDWWCITSSRCSPWSRRERRVITSCIPFWDDKNVLRTCITKWQDGIYWITNVFVVLSPFALLLHANEKAVPLIDAPYELLSIIAILAW